MYDRQKLEQLRQELEEMGGDHLQQSLARHAGSARTNLSPPHPSRSSACTPRWMSPTWII